MNEQTEPKYDFFISYADADRGWVEGYLLDGLSRSGVTYHTEATFELGVPRLSAFEDAIKQSKRTLLILSPSYLVDGSNEFIGLLVQSYGHETGTWPVIPLILQSVKLPTRLGMLTYLDATDQANWERVVQRLNRELQFPPPGPAPRPAPPYPGMRAFREDEKKWFYGREREIDYLIKRLRTNPFLALIGPSGSGKSSLVYAGLIPALRESSLFDRGEWIVRSLRPGEEPLQALAGALGGDLANPAQAVAALLSTQPNAQRLLLFVDQFEETFTPGRRDTTPFCEILLRLADTPNAYVILTVRADFYADLMATSFWPEIQKHRYEVLPLDEDGLALVIRKPAEEVGVYIEAALVERLVNDTGQEPGILPLVQETMVLLWEKVVRRYLPLSAYEALILPRQAYGFGGKGTLTGLQVAMVLNAEATLEGLDTELQIIARRIFVRLVQFGEGRPDTRRQQSADRLRTVADDPASFDHVLNHLASHRLLTLAGSEEDPNKKVDIAHEALIGTWPTLQGWLDQYRKGEQTRRRLVDDVEQWQHKDDFFLYQGTRLEEALQWARENQHELDQDQSAFLEASQKRDDRRKRVQLFLRGVIAFFALVGLLAIGFVARLTILNFMARGPQAHFETTWAWLGSDTYEDPAGRNVSRRYIEVPAFSMDKYEVTNQQYRLCVEAGACSRPLEGVPPEDANGQSDRNAEQEPLVEEWIFEKPEYRDRPVVWVTAYQAADFCRWIGRRLPTEVEWERAARGSDGRTVPWESGEAPTPEYANLRFRTLAYEASPEHPVAANDPNYITGASPEGVMHLLGNVAEWMSTPTECNDPYECQVVWKGRNKVIGLYQRGLSFFYTITDGDLAAGNSALLVEGIPADPFLSSPDVGFRCAGP
ncbi:MAG TPA: SUMF1/EgtB/PvdO family nonheme iron enzyme [Anaerolineales bacterium]|nr:SUMF1/EgtB/PvdO family nonheme iron enzyme [Anaerolineales bacterium]